MPSPAGRPAQRRARARRAFTLAELVVVLSVGGVVFSAFAVVVAQQERTHAELARRIRARAQLREGMAPLVADLQAVSPAAGDIPAGGARDSSIELRAAVGTAIVCEVRGQTLVTALASFVTPPGPGDTAWAYADDPTGAWIPLGISGSEVVAPELSSECSLPPGVFGAVPTSRTARPRYSLTLSEPAAGAVRSGTPVRVTRRVRYSLYRAPDAKWYLGRREWSAAQGRFETVQPVSGPYREYAAAAGYSGLELLYIDGADAPLASGSAETQRIARVVITLRTSAPGTESHPRNGHVTTVAVALANRR